MTDAEKKPREWAIAPGYTVAIKNDFSWQDAKTWFQHQEGLNPERVIEFSAFQEAQEKIKQLEARVEKLILHLVDFAENGTRHDTKPTGIIKQCGCFDSFKNDNWQGYIISQDESVRIRARAALKEDEEQTK